MIEFIGIGDLHLTDDRGHGGLAKYVEQPDQYVMNEVQRVIAYARKKQVEWIVFYGDLCENPRMSYDAHLAFLATIRANRDMNFVAYLGNHDKLARNSAEGHSLQLIEAARLKNLRIITEDTEIDLGGGKVKVCPWPSTKFDPKLLNLGHIEVQGSKLDSGRKIENDELPKSKAVICMGHLHTNHKIRNTFYSGTLYQTNFGEQQDKFFHHVRFTDPEDFEIESVPFKPKYVLHNCVVETDEDVAALPTDPHHLIKLVVKDGADVVVPNRPNIVINKTYKTKEDLTQILTEDLMNGQELVIKSADFFAEWLALQSVPQRLKKRTAAVRERLLSGSK